MIDKAPVKLALAWLIPAVGAAPFVSIQRFSDLNVFVDGGGTMRSMMFDPAALRGVSIFHGAWVVLGGLLSIMSTLAGVFDGLRDGGHPVGPERLAITPPGVVAFVFK